MKSWMQCEVYPGQFSSEYAVIVRGHEGQTFSLFVPKNLIRCEQQPTQDQGEQGWLSVEVLQEENELYLVRLPRHTLENGQFMTVLSSQLEAAPKKRGAQALLQ